MEDTGENPFAPKTKMRRSPPPASPSPSPVPNNNHGNQDAFNPFKPKKRLARSPVRSGDGSFSSEGTENSSMDYNRTFDNDAIPGLSPTVEYNSAFSSPIDGPNNSYNYESSMPAYDTPEPVSKPPIRSKTKSPATKKFVKKERPKSIATDKIVQNNASASSGKVPDRINESDIIYGQSKTTDNIVTGPMHDGSGEEPVTAADSENGDRANKGAAEATNVDTDDSSSPLAAKRTYLVQQSDNLNGAMASAAPADNLPVQKAHSDSATLDTLNPSNAAPPSISVDVTQSTNSIGVCRVDANFTSKQDGSNNQLLAFTETREETVVSKPGKCVKHLTDDDMDNDESSRALELRDHGELMACGGGGEQSGLLTTSEWLASLDLDLHSLDLELDSDHVDPIPATMLGVMQTLEVTLNSCKDEQLRAELKQEMDKRLGEMEHEWRRLVDEKAEENRLQREQIDSLLKSQEVMKTVVSEYEKTIQQIIAEKEKLQNGGGGASKETVAELVHERDQALEDLRSVENSFSDLHRRYEKMKATIDGFKNNEDTLKKCVEDLQSRLKKQEEKYQQLKKHAEEKLDSANDEIDKVRRQTQVEATRLQAALKRAEIQVQSLEQANEQKTKENKELSSICDELMAKLAVAN